MTANLKKAALLVDWENLAGRVGGHPWWMTDPSELIELLVETASSRCGHLGSHLGFKGYFHAAERPIAPRTATTFLKNGFQAILAGSAKNAADTRLIVQTIRLESQGYDHFFVVTGDEDFVDLGRAIQDFHPDRLCFIWPVDDRNLRGGLRDYENMELLCELLSMQPGKRPEVDDVDEFCLCIQRLIDKGAHIGNWIVTARQLAEDFELGGAERVSVLYQTSKHQKIAEETLVVRGRTSTRRRLRYEDPQLRALLEAADRVLEVVSRKHGAAGRADLLSTIPAEDQAKFAALPDALVTAGYLELTGDDHFTYGASDASYGIIRPLRRLALCHWHQSEVHPNWSQIGPKALAECWARQAAKGKKNPSPEEQSLWLAEGRRMLRRAEAAGLFVPQESQQGDRTFFGYKLVPKHPIVLETEEVVRYIWRLLPEDGSTVERSRLVLTVQEDNKAPRALGKRESDFDFWLGTMASERVVNMFNRQVQRNRNSPFRRWAASAASRRGEDKGTVALPA